MSHITQLLAEVDLHDDDGGGEVVQAVGLIAFFAAVLAALIAVAPTIGEQLATLFEAAITNVTF